jgi:hypothetical protein
MGALQFNASNQNHVVSAQSVTVLTAAPNTWLLIFTGQAMVCLLLIMLSKRFKIEDLKNYINRTF